LPPLRLTDGTPYQSDANWADVESLYVAYSRNDWPLVKSRAVALLDAHTKPKLPWDLTRDYVSLVLVDTEIGGDAQLFRLLLHHGTYVPPYSATIPRIRGGRVGFHEVLVARSSRARLQSQYSFEEIHGGPSDKAAAFLKGIDLGSIAGRLTLLGEPPREDPKAVWLISSYVPLPSADVKVSVHSVALIPPLQATVQEKAIVICERARRHVTGRGDALITTLEVAIDQCSACQFPDSMKAIVQKTLSDGHEGVSREDWEAIIAASDEVANLTKPSAIKGDIAFVNQSPERFAFGAGTAVVRCGRPRRPTREMKRIATRR